MSSNLSVEFLKSASRIIKSLGHPIRLRIIEYLESGEKSVGDIQRYIGLSQPITSQHLRYMYSRGVLKFRREGTTFYYSIASEFIFKILDCVSECQQKVASGEWAIQFTEQSHEEE